MAFLHKAVADNSIQQVQILIENGVDVNEPRLEGSDPHGKGTPLHAAAYKGYEEIAELLISNGALLEAKNHNDQTTLQVAAFWNNSNIVKLLLSKGADPLKLPLDFAILHRFQDAAEFIIQNDSKIINEDLYIHMAIEVENSKIVHLLLSKGANVDAIDEFKRTPLHLATELRNCEIIQLLLDFKADINAIQTWKTTKTPLQIAIMKDDKETTKILLKNGANPNFAPTNQLGFGLIPIHIGITLKVFDIVELLIAYNADLNLKDHRGYTPMHWAIHRRNMKTMKVLLMHGASVDIQDMNGNNAFEKALNMDLDHVAKMIWFDQM